MDRTPIRVEDRRQVDKLVSDESCKRKNQGRERQRERTEDPKAASMGKKERCETGSEGERQTQIIKIRKRYIAKYPWIGHITAFAHNGDLMFQTVDPTNEPAGQIEKYAQGPAKETDLFRHRGWGIKIGQLE